MNVIQDQNEMRDDQENADLGNHHQLRNPHHGLKEKMKALTQLYEQQKQSLRNPSPKPDKNRFSTHPSVDLLGPGGGSCKQESENRKKSRIVENHVMRENLMPSMPISTVTRTYVLPQPPPAVDDAAKENIAVVGVGGFGGGGNVEKIVGFTCPPKRGVTSTNVARKLSMGNTYVAPDPKAAIGDGGEGVVKNAVENEVVNVKLGTVGSRILVFVRVRPLSKKEKEAGSRSCVCIVNQKEVYLTEFANENDYLRLKRVRGRHFTFDASFPDSSSQREVYSTS